MLQYKNGKRLGNRRSSLEQLEPRQLLTSVVFDESLQSPWQNWSWDTTVDETSTVEARSGSNSIAATVNNEWGGFYIGSNEGTPAEPTDEIAFAIHGGNDGGQLVNFFVVNGEGEFLGPLPIALEANQWTEYELDLADFGSPSHVDGFVWQDRSGGALPTFYVDDVEIGDLADEPPPVEPGDGTVIYDDQDSFAVWELVVGNNRLAG